MLCNALDGEHIFLHGGFPKLKQGITNFLQCECSVDQISRAVSHWNAAELEHKMQALGLCATKCRSPHEWRQSEQGRAVLSLRELEFVHRGGRGGERQLVGGASRPLSDVLVVDFSHVIASPVVGRSLADHGATIIKVVSHSRPRRELFDAEVRKGDCRVGTSLSLRFVSSATEQIDYYFVDQSWQAHTDDRAHHATRARSIVGLAQGG